MNASTCARLTAVFVLVAVTRPLRLHGGGGAAAVTGVGAVTDFEPPPQLAATSSAPTTKAGATPNRRTRLPPPTGGHLRAAAGVAGGADSANVMGSLSGSGVPARPRVDQGGVELLFRRRQQILASAGNRGGHQVLIPGDAEHTYGVAGGVDDFDDRDADARASAGVESQVDHRRVAAHVRDRDAEVAGRNHALGQDRDVARLPARACRCLPRWWPGTCCSCSTARPRGCRDGWCSARRRSAGGRSRRRSAR